MWLDFKSNFQCSFTVLAQFNNNNNNNSGSALAGGEKNFSSRPADFFVIRCVPINEAAFHFGSSVRRLKLPSKLNTKQDTKGVFKTLSHIYNRAFSGKLFLAKILHH